MTTHEQFADELPLYAMGSLAGEERAAWDRHLEECTTCRQEVERLHSDLALLALSAAGPSPPQRARQRLLKAIAREPRPLAVSVRRRWWMLAPIFVSVVLAIFAMLLWRENTLQREQIAALRLRAAQEQPLLKQAQEVLAVLTAPDAQHVTLVAAQSRPQPAGKAIYLPRKGGLVFMASNLAPLPPRKTYQLWLLPSQGGAPLPAGIFRPDARGAATVIMPPLPLGVEATNFAVTVEPAGGSSTPTMPIVLVGAGQ
jgi:anti-sigma-K factor RskA